MCRVRNRTNPRGSDAPRSQVPGAKQGGAGVETQEERGPGPGDGAGRGGEGRGGPKEPGVGPPAAAWGMYLGT